MTTGYILSGILLLCHLWTRGIAFPAAGPNENPSQNQSDFTSRALNPALQLAAGIDRMLNPTETQNDWISTMLFGQPRQTPLGTIMAPIISATGILGSSGNSQTSGTQGISASSSSSLLPTNLGGFDTNSLMQQIPGALKLLAGGDLSSTGNVQTSSNGQQTRTGGSGTNPIFDAMSNMIGGLSQTPTRANNAAANSQAPSNSQQTRTGESGTNPIFDAMSNMIGGFSQTPSRANNAAANSQAPSNSLQQGPGGLIASSLLNAASQLLTPRLNEVDQPAAEKDALAMKLQTSRDSQQNTGAFDSSPILDVMSGLVAGMSGTNPSQAEKTSLAASRTPQNNQVTQDTGKAIFDLFAGWNQPAKPLPQGNGAKPPAEPAKPAVKPAKPNPEKPAAKPEKPLKPAKPAKPAKPVEEEAEAGGEKEEPAAKEPGRPMQQPFLRPHTIYSAGPIGNPAGYGYHGYGSPGLNYNDDPAWLMPDLAWESMFSFGFQQPAGSQRPLAYLRLPYWITATDNGTYAVYDGPSMNTYYDIPGPQQYSNPGYAAPAAPAVYPPTAGYPGRDEYPYLNPEPHNNYMMGSQQGYNHPWMP